MKKVLLGLFALASVSAVAAEGVNVYGRLGLDVYSHYNKLVDREDGQTLLKAKGKVAPSIALEVTKDLGSNFEAGLGLGYVWHGKRDYKETDDKDEYTAKFPAINSIPLYVTGKYKFDTGSDIKPYVKADLGYSFNKMKKSIAVTEKDLTTGETETVTAEGLKAKNGLYAGIGAGVEYNNVTADLSYVFTGAKYKDIDGDTAKANKGALRLTVGYKFAF
ncbi:outer membrane protein [Fusobacterium massiliense]|jgi:possible outer membrane protein ompW|uniref:outer membrane protein n=1 Tax=Fusobacterium massiliense TaxID=1852365 RepID=UPI000938E770|nr:outer membrane beta-barrel protein [Fusobacterium massiliense]